ncbi:lysoplasmalogenase family protein [Maritimibacter sp. UBA3975]|uniref:lysoplasmalogenase family protein n=1 Tax=Maritimibacter sp. UBA3975 TaxID=1946833 RepID=UPI0025BC12AA|nr:lysoplasmalogenase family protein [Maritimibacter sp. UBA3975]|tara:strand:+ start:2229 stop:2855 length:627 start_codon:yes stop_codon:yes gene_type:complete
MIAPLLVWTGILAAMIYLPLTEDEPSWPRTLVKVLPLAVFAGAAWLSGNTAFLVAGLLLSAVGDGALSRHGQQAFLFGLAAFALAHLLYALHFLVLSQTPLWEAFIVNTPMAVFLVAFAVLGEVWLIPYTRHLAWPVRVYVGLITLMGLAALTLPIGTAFLGAAFFIASDTLLAFLLFRLDEENPLTWRLGWAVWIFYIAGQAMILSA